METLLSRQAILDAQDLRVEEIEVPEWGGRVRVRELSADDVARWQGGRAEDGSPEENYVAGMASLIALSVVDEAGTKVFTEDDARALAAKNMRALQRVFAEALAVNGLSAEAQEGLEKN